MWIWYAYESFLFESNAAIKKKNLWVLPLYTILYLQEQNCI